METIKFNAPFNKEITISESTYDGGMPLLSVRIKEGKRFTTLELDADTATTWANAMLEWAGRQDGEG
ncbi:DUF6967 family protein [Endothiovibrio diazotrophicus]